MNDKNRNGEIPFLDCSKAAAILDWHPAMDVDGALAWTVAWYDAYVDGADMQRYTLNQIAEYQELWRV